MGRFEVKIGSPGICYAEAKLRDTLPLYPTTPSGEGETTFFRRSEILSSTENDERPENGAHNEHEEDRLTS